MRDEHRDRTFEDRVWQFLRSRRHGPSWTIAGIASGMDAPMPAIGHAVHHLEADRRIVITRYNGAPWSYRAVDPPANPTPDRQANRSAEVGRTCVRTIDEQRVYEQGIREGIAAERARGDDGRAGAYAAGEHAATARIVAWLRTPITGIDEAGEPFLRRARVLLDMTAEMIERGEHEEGAE